jgi:hypothetical protein
VQQSGYSRHLSLSLLSQKTELSVGDVIVKNFEVRKRFDFCEPSQSHDPRAKNFRTLSRIPCYPQNLTTAFDTTNPPPSLSPSPSHSVKMGRMHSNGKGISASAIPYSRTPPQWLKTTPQQVVDNICKLAKKGATPSQIGVVLRDSHGIAQVKVVTGMDLLDTEK